jgi:hypothetical protein
MERAEKMMGFAALYPSYDSDSIFKQLAAVIVREGGPSSIPEAVVLMLKRRGLLDAPPARGMTMECGVEMQVRVLAARCVRALRLVSPSQ